MSLNGILGNALSGLQAAQVGMRTVSNNLVNANTPGYVRTEPMQVARNWGGVGMGVEITGIRRVSDMFLTAASLRARSDAGEAQAVHSFLDRLQTQFGGTDDPGSLFGRLQGAFGAIASAVSDPSEMASRISIPSDLQSFFDESARLSGEIRALRDEVDQTIHTHVQRVNEILAEIEALNAQTQRLTASSADTTGAENRQDQLVDELAQLMDVRSERQSDGRIIVSTGDGVSLVGQGRLEIAYTPASTGAYGADYGRISAIVPATGKQIDLSAHIRSGEIKGLMTARDHELPAISAQLAEFTAGAADALNAAHNDASAVPAPNRLEGRNTGLTGADVLGGQGRSSLAVVDASGELVSSVSIEVTASGFVVNGTPAATIDDLTAQLNAAFGGTATASFENGRLSIQAADPGHGVAALNDPDDPASIGGRGFAHFFGLNDIVDSARPGFFETGLNANSPLGTQAGAQMSFQLTGPDGRVAASVTVPADQSDLGAFVDALNDPASGLGGYGSFALSASGELAFTADQAYRNHDLKLTDDTSERGDTRIALSQLFGMGDAARHQRAEAFNVRDSIRDDPSAIAFAKLDLTGASAPGDLVLTVGDARGGQDLHAALTAPRGFAKAGGLGAGMASLESYGARLAGDVGARSARAERAFEGAQSVRMAADQKRADVEGVNEDEELARMMLYQQSYNAAARLIQASKEMGDVLINMGR